MTEHNPPTEPPRKASLREASLVLVNTGDGKGKSTAAFGTLLRAVSRGWKVGVVQFLKSGEWQVGEEKILTEHGVEWWALGDGFTWDSDNMDESEAIARDAWQRGSAILRSGKYDVVLFDEVTYPLNWGWIDLEEFVATVEARPEKTNVIITGRDAPAEVIEIADTVTEMVKVKHAFDRGVMARRGIDY